MKHPPVFALLLITATIGRAIAAGPPDDATLTTALLGAWEVMEGPSAAPYGEVIYTADGHLHGFKDLSDGSSLYRRRKRPSHGVKV